MKHLSKLTAWQLLFSERVEGAGGGRAGCIAFELYGIDGLMECERHTESLHISSSCGVADAALECVLGLCHLCTRQQKQ